MDLWVLWDAGIGGCRVCFQTRYFVSVTGFLFNGYTGWDFGMVEWEEDGKLMDDVLNVRIEGIGGWGKRSNRMEGKLADVQFVGYKPGH